MEKFLEVSQILDRNKNEVKKKERKLSDILKVNNEGLVSARNLHDFLDVKTKFNDWISGRIKKYEFIENSDFILVTEKKVTNNPKNPISEYADYAITIDMAKELSMVENNAKGKQARKYFIQVEKFWNTPEMIMKRANDILNNRIDMLKIECFEKDKVIEEQKPKVIFADAVSTSKTSILVGELAKILRQNEIAIGPNKLFIWLRDNGYLIKRKGTDWNMPTQRSMEQGLFEIKESTHLNGDGVNVTTKTPKVTGKGQQYFINKFLNKVD